MIGSDNLLETYDGIILGSTTIGAAYRNKSWISEVTDLISLDGSFDGSNESKTVGLLFGEAFGSDERTVLLTSDGDLDAAKYGMLEG